MDPELLVHIASQTKSNLEFLASQGQLADVDYHMVLERLKSISNVSATARATPPPPAFQVDDFRSSSSQNSQALFRARAVWGYNEHAQDPRDLSFSPGDIIDVLNETNVDWWEGRFNGRVGLFPSNHVEKTTSFGFPSTSMKAPPALTGEKFSSHIQTPNYQPQYITPSPGPVYTPTPMPHPDQAPYVTNTAQATVVINEQPKPSKPKKHIFRSGFGSTLAQSAVGGVGFGAGSAIGNGLVNAIF